MTSGRLRFISGPAAIHATVELDGVDVSRFVTRIELDATAGEAVRATVTLVPMEVEIETDAAITIERLSLPPADDGEVYANVSTVGDEFEQWRRVS
jgi:hypothetical protein